MTRHTTTMENAVIFAACLAALGMFIWQVPAISAWLDAHYPLTRPIPALTACPPPTESEQLHVVIHRRGEQLVAECMFVGPKGAYVRRGQ